MRIHSHLRTQDHVRTHVRMSIPPMVLYRYSTFVYVHNWSVNVQLPAGSMSLMSVRAQCGRVDALANITDGCFIRPSVGLVSSSFLSKLHILLIIQLAFYRKEVLLYFNTSLWLVSWSENVFVIVQNRCLTRATDSWMIWFLTIDSVHCWARVQSLSDQKRNAICCLVVVYRLVASDTRDRLGDLLWAWRCV